MPQEFWFSPWVLGLFGLCIGSFLNVVVHRMPRMLNRRWMLDGAYQLTSAEVLQRDALFKPHQAQSLASQAVGLVEHLEALPRYDLIKPRSACPACGHQLRWHENLPLLGWLRLKGRCSACGVSISARYPIVELATGLLFAAVAWRVGPNATALLWCGVSAVLVAASAIDWDTTLLPDALTLPLLWAGLVAASLGWTVPLSSSIWGAVAGYLSLWTVYWVFKLATGKDGMGYGDFKLLAALGAWLGWNMLLPVVLTASAFGALVGVGMKFSGALREGRYVPFGPFLAGAGLAVFFAGHQQVLVWMGWA
jgi:leader peptidase (prepilin peptidase) / N-methyltransferase